MVQAFPSFHSNIELLKSKKMNEFCIQVDGYVNVYNKVEKNIIDLIKGI